MILYFFRDTICIIRATVLYLHPVRIYQSMKAYLLSLSLSFAISLLPLHLRAQEADANVGANMAVQDSISGGEINEVVVTGTRSALNPRHLSQTVSVVGRGEIERQNRVSLLPLLNESVPGLFTTSRGVLGYGVSGGAAGNISMRGLAGGSSRLLVLIDGHPQYAGIFGHPIADACNSYMAERVEVLRGPASLLYGSNAMGGVVNVITRRDEADALHTNLHLGYGRYNTMESEISNSFKRGRLSTFASISYNRTDGHREYIAPDNSSQGLGFKQVGGVARVAYSLAANWKISADINLMNFRASQPGAEETPLIDAYQNITRGVAALYLENKYEETSGGISLFYNWGHHWINDGYAPGAAPKAYRFISNDDMMGASAYQTLSLLKGNRTTFGVDLYRYGGKAINRFISGPQEGSDVLQVDENEWEAAAYADFRQDLAGFITLNAGLRVDRHFSIGTEVVPQFGLTFRLPKQSEFKLSATKGFRYPIIREMYMYPPKNPNLKPERLWNYELAFSQKLLGGAVNYGLNLFYIKADNIILTAPNPAGAGMLNQNSGELNNYGVEAEVALRLFPMLAFGANYSYLHMKEPVVAAPEHKLNLSLSYSKGAFRATCGYMYIGGLYTSVAPVSKEYYSLLNLKLSLAAAPWLTIWINGDNLTNSAYEVNAGFPMPRASYMLGLNISL